MAAAPFTVTHFSTHDTLGGSARSASKIHHTLQELGVRSRMLVRHQPQRGSHGRPDQPWPLAGGGSPDDSGHA